MILRSRPIANRLIVATCVSALIFVFYWFLAQLPILYELSLSAKKASQATHAVKENIKQHENQALPRKHFQEATFDVHYDARFGKWPLSYQDRRTHLSALIQTYFSFVNEIGIETWIMHGSLLGWFWNRQILPWDHDLDVQVLEDNMQLLADHYNMTLYPPSTAGVQCKSTFLLEINPNWLNPDAADLGNKIDARWLDTEVGLYIDITVLRQDGREESKDTDGGMMCKDGHRYMRGDIFPLQNTTFEGVNARVPFAYSSVLAKEYGIRSLSDRVYENHHFDTAKNEWVRNS